MVNFSIKIKPNNRSPDLETGDFFAMGNSEDLSKGKSQEFTQLLQKYFLTSKEHVLTCTPQLQSYAHALIIIMRVNGSNH